MDNVTHSLAGLLLAESAVRLRASRERREPSPRFQSVAAISSLIAANLPDADLLYTGIGGDRLRYMLHHRGHTHTVVVAIIGALLVWAIATLVWRWREREAPSGADARWLFGLLLVSTLSHLLLDWTNSYGVHPFWPVDDRWRYGDTVFIIEPWLWVVSVPTLVAASAGVVRRVLLSLVLVAAIGLAWRTGFVSTGAAAVLTAGAVLSVLLTRVLRPGARAAAALFGWVAVTSIMAAGANAARRATLDAAREADPAAELLDVVVTPFPANALCMSVITVERSGSTYRLTTGRASAAPRIVDAAHCGTRSGRGSMLLASTRRSTPMMQWDGEWSAPSGELVSLVRASCPALAAMRFIRVPIWRAVGDSSVLVGDVRFGGGSGNGFTDVRVRRGSATCPRGVPPWTPPRADIIGGGW